MRTWFLSLAVLLTAVGASAQSTPFARLPVAVLDVIPPEARVTGAPGGMSVQQTSCRALPAASVRRRIVDVAVQEWAFFGFSVIDQTQVNETAGNQPNRRRRLDPIETARVAASIAGYWTVTPEASWILENQNEIWNGPRGAGERWRTPWSAAFISWVMCEGGLAETSQFRRAIAHHSYIDQAIRARDEGSSTQAYAAYDAGEAGVAPGDLLCTARRPEYRSLADRRRQMGEGARSHCDVVVKVDETAGHILAIGGNVRGTVSLKVLPAIGQNGRLRPVAVAGERAVFAHLKLRSEPVEMNALDHSATVAALGCAGAAMPATVSSLSLLDADTLLCAD